MTDVQTTPVECPSCGRISRIDPTARSRNEFCGYCDYPLFFAVQAPVTVPAELGEGRRRLPGMSGLRTIGALPCRNCTEPNPARAEVCIRCGSVLHPDPVVVEPTVVIEPEVPEVEVIRPPIPSMRWIYTAVFLVPTVLLLLLLAIVG